MLRDNSIRSGWDVVVVVVLLLLFYFVKGSGVEGNSFLTHD